MIGSVQPGAARWAPLPFVRARWPLVLGVLLAVVAGCRTPTPPIDFVPSGQVLAPDDARAASTLAAYRDDLRARDGLRGSARVAVKGPDFQLNRPQRIVLERPARLRFEILGLFDQLAAVLVTDGRRYGFFDASSGDVSRGPVSASLLWELARIDLSPHEAVGLLLGAPEPEPGTLRAGAWLEPAGRLVLAFAWPATEGVCAAPDAWDALFDPGCVLPERALQDAGGQLFFFDGEGTLVEVRALEPGGELRYRAVFEEHAPIRGADGEDGVNFPKRVTLQSPIIGSEARFDWKRVMLASDLSDRLFHLPDVRRSGRGG